MSGLSPYALRRKAPMETTMMIIPLAIGGLLVYLFLRQQGAPSAGRRQGPLDILKERYARGEISREDYERMRHDIESQ
jgi:putative membrane protein